MNREKITLEKSSEFLRLALPFMSRFSIPVTPQNYSVWYEYVAGNNLSLQERINELINKEQVINEDVTLDLYTKYVDPTDFHRIDEAQKILRSLAESVMSSIDSANGEVVKYEKSLKECESSLNENINQGSLKTLIYSLVESTTRMSEGNQELQKNLKESRREAEVLRVELNKSRAEAQTDALTGLANRKAFDDILTHLAGENKLKSEPACLLLCDIDNFKNINDTYGHLIGDKVITTVACVLKKQVKGKDLPARYGGEEFIVLLPGTEIKGASALAESIRRTIASCRVIRPKTGEEIRRVTISIGVTRFTPGEDFKETMARADAALYQAKSNGRNRVETLLPTASDKVAGSVLNPMATKASVSGMAGG